MWHKGEGFNHAFQPGKKENGAPVYHPTVDRRVGEEKGQKRKGIGRYKKIQ